MLKFAVLLSVLACALAGTIPDGLLPQLDGRIVGGYETSIDAHPYQVSLQRYGSHFCGGFIYSHDIVITAAHCLQSIEAKELKIRVGSTYWRSSGSVHSLEHHRVRWQHHSRSSACPLIWRSSMCRVAAPDEFGYGKKIKNTMLCAYAPNKDACQGDSGGPLVSGDRLVGIVFWGYGCGDVRYPGVYADVAHFHEWIERTAEEV
ncbi:GM20440 [Drosophila sechellia]|uniref:trypsin n=1 Tax=Drosophila sechellia TaxID=7238 RepID=B4HNG2_DROSE|nr:GM20440 [Drosophila sechellia]